MKPVAIDLFCGKGGWTIGLQSVGYHCIGFDIERHDYPGELVLQDVATIDGAQLAKLNPALIVASPPCQAYSYRAMPWKRARTLPPPDNTLFEACFRIQRECSEALGRHVPMVVENVCGAQKWVGRAKWHYGSYYLWGDVPALMPSARHFKVPSFRFSGNGGSFQSASVRRTDPGKGARFTPRDCGLEGLKFGGGWWHDSTNNLIHKAGSHSPARKEASALIAMIPQPLAEWIGRVYQTC
jgi:hypothetical protein